MNMDTITQDAISKDDSSLLATIVEFCRQGKMAESTFGRRSVNDGKFVSRLRAGSRVTPETWEKVTTFITANGGVIPAGVDSDSMYLMSREGSELASQQPDTVAESETDADNSKASNFRFFDNRQKYLLFINTCNEKDKIAERIGQELVNLKPSPPAIRVFDAGIGDGTVLTRVLRQMHCRYPTMPFYVSGKEVSLEDVRLTLAKVADRVFEHPATVLVFTNMYYSEAPWLTPGNEEMANSVVWKEVALSGNTAFEFDEQIKSIDEFLVENWQAKHSPRTGNPIYERPSVLVIYREDYRFLLDDVIPKPGPQRADFDLVIASQPYRSRMSAQFKVEKVVAPLTRALAKGGKLLGIHSYGNDPGLKIIRRVWPGEKPFMASRHDILNALKEELGDEARDFQYSANSDDRAVFSYEMHALPTEISTSIGTSTLFAAWNAAVYVAQIEDDRLNEAMASGEYLKATQETLNEYGGLWFNDETYVVTRKTRG
ncbi:MAG: hypothetical protein ACI9H8_001160 [Lysobacterales bacterium]|jgi:hypothetical protein